MAFGDFMSGFIGSGGMDAIGNVGKGMKGNMTDDKGLFQGGSQNETFGRIKDMFGGKKRKEEGARDFMKDFDPTNKDSVTDMQKRLNSAGGNLKVDGIMGPKTLQAVRAMQAGGGAGDAFSPAHPPQNSASMTGIAPSPMQQQQMMGQGPMLQMPQAPNPVSAPMGPMQSMPQAPNPVSPAMGPMQQGPQDPYGFGVDASGDQYGGGVGPWAPR